VAGKAVEVDVEGRRLRLTNLDKVLYPAVGFTKGQVIDYLTRAAPYVLPHLRDRALTLKRYPNGVDAGHFYEKQRPSHAPEWVRSVPIVAGGRTIDFVVCDDLPTLVWLANLADLELHPSLALVDDADCPTVVAFDLDPGEPAGLQQCCKVALMLREVLDALELDCFAKTSGSKGMQVYLPLNTETTYDETKPFAHGVARLLESREPDLIVSVMRKSERRGKVFIDWSQNDRHKTTIGVHSLRAQERPTVSTPLWWEEVEGVAGGGDPRVLVAESSRALERLEADGDPFAPVLELEQGLPDLGVH
jgi:bifunctional non-homologous end joining protein LigD